MTQYYARQDGSSPLTLEFEITQELLNRGNDWKLTLVNFQSATKAQGTVSFQLPPSSNVNQLSGQEAAVGTTAGTGAATTTTSTQTQPRATSETAPAEKVGTGAAKTGTVSQKPKLKDLLSGHKVEKQEIQVSETPEDLGVVQQSLQNRIQEVIRSSEVGGIWAPLFFKYLEEVADNPKLVREYYRSSKMKRNQTEQDFTMRLQAVIQAYKSIPREFKARHFNRDYVDLKKGDRVDIIKLGDNVVRVINPNFPGQIKRIVSESFSSGFKINPEQVQVGQIAGTRKPSEQTAKVSAQARINRPAVNAAASNLLARIPAAPSQNELNQLKNALQQAGYDFPERATSGSLVHNIIGESTFNYLALPGGWKSNITDYYRYKVTLDLFKCLEKNEKSDDEPYFGIITSLPYFDSSDTSYFRYLKDGCLNHTDSYVTPNYHAGKNSTHPFRDQHRIIFDYLTFNSPASFAIQLWENDYSKGSVADAIDNMARDIMHQMQGAVRAAVISALLNYFMDAIMSSGGGGVSSSQAMTLLQQVLTGNLSFVEFQNLLFSLFSGRAFDPSWYLIYFLFTGGDFMKMLALMGGGLTFVGAFFLAAAIIGPAIAEMGSAFVSGDTERGWYTLLKIILVVPLIKDFLWKIVCSLEDFFEFILAVIDPDDFIGQKNIVIQKTSSDWHADAGDGEWQNNLLESVPISQADSLFAQRGYGPTRANSSFMENGKFWVPGFTIEEDDAKYNIYYEVFREVAGGRTTLSFYFPEGMDSKYISYHGKSSSGAWWTNIIKVAVVSLNTEQAPLIFITDKITGKTYSNAEQANYFEFEASKGADYDIWVFKLFPGQMGGYISIYEGPKVDIKCDPLNDGDFDPRQKADYDNSPPGSSRQIRLPRR